MILATPYRRRVIPCGLVARSSRTIAQNADSRNLNHFRIAALFRFIYLAQAEMGSLKGRMPLHRE